MDRKVFCVLALPIIYAGLMLSASCASMNKPKRTVLERIPPISSQPDWTLSTTDYWIKNDNIYSFKSADSDDLKGSLANAESAARKKLSEHAKNIMSAEFERVMELQKYDLSTGEYLENAFSAALDKIKISGVSKKDSYSEKISEVSKKGKRIFYRSYILAELAGSNYEKNFQQLMVSLKADVKQNRNALKLAEIIDKNVKKKLK